MTPSDRLSEQLHTWNREAAREPDGLDQGKRIYWFLDHADALAEAITFLENVAATPDSKSTAVNLNQNDLVIRDSRLKAITKIAREQVERLKPSDG